MSYRHYLILLLYPLFVSAGSAQDSESLLRHDVGASGECPSVDQVEENFGRSSYSVGAGWTFVLARNPHGFKTALPASEPTSVVPPLFDKVTIYSESQDRGRLLVGWGGGQKHCAWVSTGDLLLREASDPYYDYSSGPKPVLVGEIDDDDPNNSLSLKAVLSNLNIEGDAGVAVYENPDDEVKRSALKLFEFYSVFARARGIPRGETRADTYYLLGKSGFHQEELIGWVHEEDVYLWNSRMAVSWAGSGSGQGWAAEPMQGDPIIFERVPLPEPLGRSGERFPVLEMSPISVYVQKKADRISESERTPLALSKLVDRYRIVARGLACRGEEECLSPEEFAALRSEYEERVAALRRIDLLFLIDATESMQVYFTSTAAAIRDFARQQLGTSDSPTELDIRVGVSMYGDYGDATSSPASVAFEEVVPLHDPRTTDYELSKLDTFAAAFDARAPQDPHGDRLEAPLAALVRAAQEAGWRDDAGVRIIIHVGDHGSRELGALIGRGPATEAVTVDDVVHELAAKRLVYLPISVVGEPEEEGAPGEESREGRRAFLRQAEAILLGRGLPEKVIRSYTDPSARETEIERYEALSSALSESADAYFKAKEIVDIQETCERDPSLPICADLPDLGSQGGDISTGIAERVIVESQLTREQTANIFSRSETVLYAWVPPVDGDVEILSYWVALDEDRLQGLVEVFRTLCSQVHPDSGDFSIRISDAIAAVSRTGSSQPDLSMHQSLAIALSLPFWERMDVMSIPLDRIERIIREGDPETIFDWRRKFCLTATLLGYVRTDRRITDVTTIPFDEEGVTLDPPAASLIPYMWLVRVDQGEGFYFIPIEYFP